MSFDEDERKIIIYPPSSIIMFLVLLLLLFPIFLLIGLGFLSYGFIKIGLTPGQTILILSFSLAGSFVNIPIRRKDIVIEEDYEIPRLIKYIIGLPPYKIRTQVLCINLGGALIPLIVSLYIALRIPLLHLMISTAIIAVISRLMSKVIKGVGIILPAFIPPLISAMIAMLLLPENPAGLAYASGVMGTLIGADLLNLGRIRDMPGVISIGGAGIFDGIFLTGVLAAILS
ncbi:hypothetical protein DRN86_00690 [Candidatus Geothermarchaeota archaeon]|nr:MAG: hypothetical protein DRN86_00690 [Candidatus Geothermarchaeota archaeon]